MRNRKLKKVIIITLISGFVVAISLVIYAFARTWHKTEIEFRIHINDQLVKASTFGEPPTFAIWLENPRTGMSQTVFVTKRAASGDWEGKTDVPVALPKWFEVYKIENRTKNLPTFKKPAPMAVTGATPQPGYFKTRVSVRPGSKWICWIEVNLAGDFNEYYQEYNEKKKTVDEFATGQPALLYRTEVEAVPGKVVKPEIVGMSMSDSPDGKIIHSLKGITTANDIFDKIEIDIVRPNPKIIK